MPDHVAKKQELLDKALADPAVQQAIKLFGAVVIDVEEDQPEGSTPPDA